LFVFKRLKKLWQERSPGSYRRYRSRFLNLMNHVYWVGARHYPALFVGSHDPYDTEYWHAQEGYDYPAFARALLDQFRFRRAVDVGCGSGNLLAALAQVDPSLDLLGLDNSPAAVTTATGRRLPIQALDLVSMSRFSPLVARLGRFDAAISLEVAEHLPVWHVGKLLALLTGVSDTVIFSAAQPLQGGIMHLNEQPLGYWIRRFARRGYPLDRGATGSLREQLGALTLPPWYRANILVFRKAPKAN
jgi:SAM-dependent methyltransferase